MENMTRDSLRALGITDEKMLDGILAMRSNEITEKKYQIKIIINVQNVVENQ